MIGLAVMSFNLVLNIAEHGFSVAGFDKDLSKAKLLNDKSSILPVNAVSQLTEFFPLLKEPRIIIMLVPAGPPVDDVIQELLPSLTANDLLIDAGNSHFKDSNLRAEKLLERGISFLNIGISGGEFGARRGPCIMTGGPKDAYERIRPVLESVAARINDVPCVAYLGPSSAGHYVKMVHNGLEYAIMQLVTETYDIMKRGLTFTDDQLSSIYAKWHKGLLDSFLIEITADIFRAVDEKTGKRLVDVLLDVAKQKGTGMWTSENAMQLHVAVPNIDAAIEMRDLSCCKNLRLIESKMLSGPKVTLNLDSSELIDDIAEALYASIIIACSQAFCLLDRASKVYNYDLNLKKIASIWRGSGIIGFSVLDEIVDAYNRHPDLLHLLDDPNLSDVVVKYQASLRSIVQITAALGIPAPGMMAALAYYDALRSSWLPANLIQAQRDFFLPHTCEGMDVKGTLYTKWSGTNEQESLYST